ncbi:IS701 family transposase, partial [Rhodococcus sp. WS4]
GPRRTTLTELATIAGSRWRVEECFQQAKNEAGLDHYQVRTYRVRTYRAWYAHITLSMLALAWLAGTKTEAVKGESEPKIRA